MFIRIKPNTDPHGFCTNTNDVLDSDVLRRVTVIHGDLLELSKVQGRVTAHQHLYLFRAQHLKHAVRYESEDTSFFVIRNGIFIPVVNKFRTERHSTLLIRCTEKTGADMFSAFLVLQYLQVNKSDVRTKITQYSKLRLDDMWALKSQVTSRTMRALEAQTLWKP